jgi:integrase
VNKSLSDRVIADIIKFTEGDNFINTRNRIYVILSLNTGLRISEITNLKWVDVNFRCGTLFVRNGKGGKARTIKLNNYVMDRLKFWHNYQIQHHDKKPSYVLTTFKGTKTRRRYYTGLLIRITDKIKSDFRITPNIFRHTFATRLFEQTKSLQIVMDYLGHEDLTSTAVYLHTDYDENNLSDFRVAI